MNLKKGIMTSFVLGGSILLTGCGENHVHEFGDWKVSKAQTLFTDGEESRVCTADDGAKEVRTIKADGKTSNVFDYFTVYSDNATKAENGIVLNGLEGQFPSTYLSKDENIKNFEWNGEKITIGFTLDLTALSATNDYTTFVLGFNKAEESNFIHQDEIRVGIAKAEEGYKVAELNGIDWTNHSELQTITASDKTITGTTANVEFTATFSSNTLTYSIKVNETVVSNDATREETNAIVGIRYLWNAYASKDGVILSNLIKK